MTDLPAEATKEPCNQCPWRRAAAPGYLGPHSATDWITMIHSDTAIACHKTIKKSGSWEGTKQCRGAAIFRRNVAKSPRDYRVVTGPRDVDRVFATNSEFVAHHEGVQVVRAGAEGAEGGGSERA